MNENLRNKIILMKIEKLQSIVDNSELYSSDAIEIAKQRLEELERMDKINSVIKEKFESMSDEEKCQVLKEPELYSGDMIKLANEYKQSKKADFSDVPQEAKDKLSKMSAEQLLDMLDAKEDILSESIVNYIKEIASQKINEPEKYQEETFASKITLESKGNIGVADNQITVLEGHYSVWKKFFGLIYRTMKTDLSFQDDKIVMNKGTGFSKVKHTKKAEIKYEDISCVRVRRKIDTTNSLLAILVVAGAVITQAWVALITVVFILYWGLTAVATIYYNDNMLIYDIPTEFKSDALEVKEKIELALSQYNGKCQRGERI